MPDVLGSYFHRSSCSQLSGLQSRRFIVLKDFWDVAWTRTERDFIANQIRPELPTGVKALRACLGDTTNGASVVGPFSYAADTIKMGAAISGGVGLSNFNRKQVTDVVTSYDISGFIVGFYSIENGSKKDGCDYKPRTSKSL